MDLSTACLVVDGFDDEEVIETGYCWPFWARPAQVPPPGDWVTWLLLGIVLWLVYGLMLMSWPIIASNVVTILLVGLIVTLKLRYH